MLTDYPYSVILLLLQIVLKREQTLAHDNRKLSLDKLLTDPIIDEVILSEFQSHNLVKLYAPELCTVSLRGLKALVREVFDAGIPHDTSSQHSGKMVVTVVTLANYYYERQLKYLEQEELPRLKREMLQLLRDEVVGDSQR